MNEQLEMIDRVMGTLQKNVARRAVEFFRYGWVILAGCIFHYLFMCLGKPEWVTVVWIAVPILCILLGLVTGIGSTNRSNISISEKLLINTWGIIGLVLIYLSLIAPRLGFVPGALVLPLVMILMFISVVLTGLAIKHTATIALSSCWFFGSIAASLLPGTYHVHILALVVLFGYLLPAYLIKVKFL